jgi:hypothetical protein
MTTSTETLTDQPKKHTRAQEVFKNATPEYQEIIRELLREEREVLYMKTRTNIHKNFYDHIKRVIK